MQARIESPPDLRINRLSNNAQQYGGRQDLPQGIRSRHHCQEEGKGKGATFEA